MVMMLTELILLHATHQSYTPHFVSIDHALRETKLTLSIHLHSTYIIID